jgi:hypothetical protein
VPGGHVGVVGGQWRPSRFQGAGSCAWPQVLIPQCWIRDDSDARLNQTTGR